MKDVFKAVRFEFPQAKSKYQVAVRLYLSYQKKRVMDNLLDRFYEDLDYEVKRRFHNYYVKVSQLKSSFFILVKRPRGKILGDKRDFLFSNLKIISEEFIMNIVNSLARLKKNIFPILSL